MADTAEDAPQRPVEQPGPTDFHDPATARELRKAAVWLGLAVAIGLVVLLAQPLLLIVGGLVFAAMLDGGTRLLGRVLKIGRGWRLAIVCIGVVAFLAWVVYFAGYSIAAQVETLKTVVTTQVDRLLGWGRSMGVVPKSGLPAGGANEIARQLMGSLGQVTAFVGSALGAVSSLAMIVVLGLFLAAEPRLYERGFAWMLPMGKRRDFYGTSERMGHTLRRLMFGRLIGMAAEGVFTAITLSLVGVPMAMLLGILTGLLAFLPNIGAIVSGVLIILVGFSAGVNTGIAAIVVYAAVQIIDGYLVVPWVARKSVDLPPALVLGAQLLLGALFGIMGLALADPLVAMIKVLLEERSENAAEDAGVTPSGVITRA